MYVQAVKNAIIWDKKVVIRKKTIGTSQFGTCSGPNSHNNLIIVKYYSVMH